MIKQIVFYLLNILFPLSSGRSFDEFIEIVKLFPKLTRIKELIRMILLFIFYVSVITTVYPIPVTIKYLPYRQDLLSPMGVEICGVLACSLLELFAFRIWLIYIYYSKKIKFLSPTKSMESDKSINSIIKYSKISFIMIYMAGYSTTITLQLLQIYRVENSDELLVRFIWLIFILLMTRLTMNDVPLLYTIASVGFISVKKKTNQCIEHLRTNCLINFINEYKCLVSSVCDLNSLIELIMLASESLVIPAFGCVISLLIISTDSSALNLVRLTMISSAFIYLMRGYIMTAIISQIDTQSKTIHNEIFSLIVRKQSELNVHIRLLLRSIIEDLASSKNHVVLKEANGQVTQFDLMESLLSTFQFLLLVLKFKNSISNFVEENV